MVFVLVTRVSVFSLTPRVSPKSRSFMPRSVRKMFARYEIPYLSVDLDSVAYQEDNKGGNIRAALREKTGSKTIPQIFVGGQFIGGATELFDSQKDGELADLLNKSSVPFNKEVDVDPYSFLPGWLHER